jgi:hypothetical protein
MNSRSVAFASLIVLLTSLSYLLPLAQAQTTAISNFQYPSNVKLNQNGVAQATVTFTVKYSSHPSGSSIVIGVYDPKKANWAPGVHASAPDSCYEYSVANSNKAICAIYASSGTGAGEEHVSFRLVFDSPGDYALTATASFTDSSSSMVKESYSSVNFTISVT